MISVAAAFSLVFEARSQDQPISAINLHTKKYFDY
jgi:hypothetical protein